MPFDQNDKQFKSDMTEANRRANRVKTTFVNGIPPEGRKFITETEKMTLRRLIAVEILQSKGWKVTIADVP